MIRRAREINASGDRTRYALMRGLRPELRSYVMQQNPTTNDELLEAAQIAEATVVDASSSATSQILDAIRRLETRATSSIRDTRRSDTRRSFFRTMSPAPRPRSTSRTERHVRFEDNGFNQRRAPFVNDRREPSTGNSIYRILHIHRTLLPSSAHISTYLCVPAAQYCKFVCLSEISRTAVSHVILRFLCIFHNPITAHLWLLVSSSVLVLA